jgi:hypothetical protein
MGLTIMMFFACDKEVDLPIDIKNKVESRTKKITVDEMKGIRSRFQNSSKKSTILEGGHTEYIPMQNTVDVFEVILNSTYAVRYDDKSYEVWESEIVEFELDYTELNGNYFFNSVNVYTEAQILSDLVRNKELSLDPDRKFIVIDIEPLEVKADGEFRFAMTTISAKVVAGSIEDPADYYAFDWTWGNGHRLDDNGNKKTWGCFPDDLNLRTQEVGGACGVISENIKKYYFDHGSDASPYCDGTFSTDVKTMHVAPATMGEYRHHYDKYNDGVGPLRAHGIDLEEECVSGQALKNFWVPFMLKLAKDTRDLDRNPYKVRRGQNDNAFFYTESTNNPPTMFHMKYHLVFADKQCAHELSK